MAADVVIRFLADTSKLRSEMAEVENSGSRIKGWAKGIGAAIGIAFAVDQVRDWIGAASSLQDAVGATSVIFGDATKAVEKFSDKTADAFGIAKADALVAAGNFGTFGKSAGLTGKDLSKFSTELVGLSGDLASFKGTSVEEALTAVGAALRGESEPIRKYGVLLDDATLRQRAMALGLIATTKDALTPQQKVLAAHAEILAQTGDAQGDFARTSDSAANQQKALAANMKDTQAALGTALLPALQAVLPLIRSLAKFIGDNSDLLVPLAAVIGAVTIAQWAWNAAMAANPIGLAVIAIAAMAAAIYLLIKNWDEVTDFIKRNWKELLAILVPGLGITIKLIIDHWDTMKNAVGSAIDFIRGLVEGLIGFFVSIPGRIAAGLAGIFDIVTSPFRTAIDFVRNNIWDPFRRAWNAIEIRIPKVDIPLVGEIGGGKVGLPDLPALASGGIVRGPTLALLGEKGPEAVVPLSHAGTMSNVYTISVYVAPSGSPADTGRAVVDAIRSYERVAGSSWRSS